MSGSEWLAPPVATARASSRRWQVAFAPRFFLAIILGLVWLGPAWWERRFAWAMLAWDAVALLAWGTDLRRLPQPSEIAVSRTWLGPLSLGVESSLVLEVRNHTAARFRATLYDDVPPQLRPQPPRIELNVPAAGSARAAYSIRPAERGDATAGKVFLRYQSALKLAERWAAAELQQTVRVYPNLQEPKQYTLYLIRSRQIELEKRLKRQPGRGREFENLREYRPGDEPRDICWTATARRARLITKVYQVERSQAVLLALDAGRLMLARIGREDGPRTKLDYAVNAALTLAQVALYSGDRVGLLAYGRKSQARLRTARGSAHLRLLLDRLALVRGDLAEADHVAAAHGLLQMQSQRCLVVWLTDLPETAATPDVMEAASRLLPRHLVLFVAIGQPQLERLVGSKPESVGEMYRYVAAQEMVQRRELLLRGLRQQGALVLDLEPGQLALALVNQYLRVKERGLL